MWFRSRLTEGILLLATIGVVPGAVAEQHSPGTEQPPPEIVAILNAPPVPAAVMLASPGGRWLLEDEFSTAGPPAAALAAAQLDLAGWQVDPASNASRGVLESKLFQHLSLYSASDRTPVSLPAIPVHFGEPLWAPDGRRFAILTLGEGLPQLAVVDAERASVLRIQGVWLNSARIAEGYASHIPCVWSPDSRRLLCQSVPLTRGSAPRVDGSPTIRETGGAEDRLKFRPKYSSFLHSAIDEARYDYYMISQPVQVDATTGAYVPLGRPGIYKTFVASPDGRYILAVRIVKPYSYETFDNQFPTVTEVLDGAGRLVKTIAQSALDTSGNWLLGGIADGPRQFFWRPDVPATLGFFDALDEGGNADSTAAAGDRLLLLRAPFDGPPVEVFRSRGRLGFWPVRTLWGDGGIAVVEELDYRAQCRRSWKLDLTSTKKPELLWEYPWKDHHVADGQGELVTALGPFTGRDWRHEIQVYDARLLQDGDWVYLRGADSSPKGERPFLDRFNLRTHRRERLFRSAPDSYEEVVSVLDGRAHELLIWRETAAVPPNFFLVRRFRQPLALTHFTDPSPQLTHARRLTIEYRRADGLKLTGRIYLPTNYHSGDRPPLILEGYPTLTKGRPASSPLLGSNRFPRIAGAESPLPLITQGYAVFDADMSLTGGDHSSDTTNEQLAADASAAVDKLVELGIADRKRIGVTGQSYGGFMVANLLVNTRLFSAGVAFSGLYNLSTSPDGFQYETRSYWEVPSVYDSMSPFQHADKIRAPLLLLHGEQDYSAAAHPEESVRLFEALEALGTPARLVLFPNEDHSFRGKDTLLHSQWEMLRWFDHYLKSDPDTTVAQQPHGPTAGDVHTIPHVE